MEGGVTNSDSVALAAPRPDLPPRNRGSKCCSKFTSIVCSNLGVCLLVLIYTALGALLFTSLEGHTPQPTSPNYRPHDSHSQAEEPVMSEGKMALADHMKDGTQSTSLLQGTRKIDTEEIQNDHKAEVGNPSGSGAAATAAVVFAGEVDTQDLRHQTVERLWSITESLNILYRENWTRVVEAELRRYSQDLVTNLIRHHNLAAEDEAAASRKRHGSDNQQYNRQKEQWTFAGSFLYSLTVISTIGYGDVAPQTSIGRVATIIYALLGIPLMLLYLSSVGDLLSRCLKWLWCKLCHCRRRRPPPKLATPRPLGMPGPYTNVDGSKTPWPHDCHNSESGPVPVTLCLVLMAIYICGGAAIFSQTHSWPYLHALFFCFSSLTTIGFGDLNPSSFPQNTAAAQLQLLGAAFYLLIGMALIATCFNLMQEQVTARGGGGTVLTRKLGGLVTTPTPHQHFHLDDT